MATLPIYRNPLDGTEMVRVLIGGRWYMAPVAAILALQTVSAASLTSALGSALAPVLARLAALEAADTAQAARDAAQDAALGQEAAGRQAADAAEVLARQAVTAALSAEASTRQTTDAAQAGRISALESRPEEVAHFIGSAKLPAISVASTTALTLAGLVPAVTGDRVRKGEAVIVEPATALPAGVNIAAAYAPADDTVVVQITAGLAVSLGAAPITWNITVLR
ncbi:MAG: hypothetical protein INR70_02960 [Parafilimonas terrae]|nr:hypothetical protein [Parafilimonas terrae]